MVRLVTQMTTCARDQAVAFKDLGKNNYQAFAHDFATAIGSCASVNVDVLPTQ
jgi:hypothetical protein